MNITSISYQPLKAKGVWLPPLKLRLENETCVMIRIKLHDTEGMNEGTRECAEVRVFQAEDNFIGRIE